MAGISRREIVLTIIVVLGVTFMQSLAQDNDGVDSTCWDKFGTCLNDHANQSATNPKFDSSSPSFDQAEYLCCSLIQDAAKTNKPCFCLADTYIHQNPNENGTLVLQVLQICNVTDSLASLDAFCPGFDKPTAGAPAMAPVGALESLL